MSMPVNFPLCDFPSDVLKWMKQNAAPKMAVKLMKCHKCFQHFPEFPYFVVKDFGFVDEKWSFLDLDGIWHYQTIEGDEIIMAKKLWIIGFLHFIKSPISVSLLFPRIAICEIKYLQLFEQNISFNELKILTASGNIFKAYCKETTVKDENGDLVFMDEILKCFPKIKFFELFNSRQAPDFSVDFLDKKWYTFKMKKIGLSIADFNNFFLFSKFMDENPHIKYRLEFINASYLREEIQILEKYIQKFIDAGSIQNPPPYFVYPGQPREQINALFKLASNYGSRKKVRKLK